MQPPNKQHRSTSQKASAEQRAAAYAAKEKRYDAHMVRLQALCAKDRHKPDIEVVDVCGNPLLSLWLCRCHTVQWQTKNRPRSWDKLGKDDLV